MKTRVITMTLGLGSLLLLAGCGSGGGGASGGLDNPGDSLAGTAEAPEFPGGHTWFNVSEPLTIVGLRGKVVVLDFWTLGCINCQHIVPDLERLEDEFGDAIVVIGVHSGKYEREHADESIREAVLRLGLQHPVVNDPDFAIWDLYGANAWPTVAVIDPDGKIVGEHSGEGVYPVVQPAVARLIDEFGDKIDRTPIPLDLESQPVSSAFLSFPGAVLADEAGGRVFIADSGNNRILVADFDGKLERAIGSGEAGLKDGLADEAEFDQPQGLELSADGQTLYVADTRNHALRAVDLESGEVTTIAGTGERAMESPRAGADPLETALASPWGLKLAGDTLYIAMAGTHQIWTFDTGSGALAVFAGSGREGIDDGPRAEATLAQPSGLATDGTSLFWVDPESSAVRKTPLTGDGTVETLVGKGLFEFGDVDGPSDVALLEHAQGIAYADGVLYVADTYNHKIRTVDPATGTVATYAGNGEQGGADGPAASSTFSEPGGLAIAGRSLYVADTNNHAIRVIDLDLGQVTTLELTNLGIAVSGAQGRMIKVSLPAQDVSPNADSIRIKLRAPEGYHLNDLIASTLTLSTSNGDAFGPGESEITFRVSDQSVDLNVPANTGEGQAILTASGEVYYCREGEEGVCLIDKVNLALPLTVTDDATAQEALLEYELPE